MLMASDSLSRYVRTRSVFDRGISAFMPANRSHVRWTEALLLTSALWLFMLLIFMPRIVQRHGTDIGSIFLDSSTIVVSIGFGMLLFGIFNATITLPIGRRFAALLSATIAIAFLQTMFDLVFASWVAENIQESWYNLERQLSQGYEKAFRYLLVFMVNVALFQLTSARRRESIQDRQLSDARAAAQQAQLTALRYQLNPHFLFNSLNSISALIVTHRNEDAERMTEKLSTFLRNSLSADPGRLVPLEEELSLIEEYLDIEGVRFGERLDVEIECEPDAGAALVPSFIVQPLVENAIKHGVAPSRAPVRIRIGAAVEGKDLCIEVENGTSPVLDEPSFGAGVGLKNIRRRLQAVYGRRASLDTKKLPDRFLARICIPEVQRQN
jgi:sensor histidine kinase YesM